jgi:hypothetical protein
MSSYVYSSCPLNTSIKYVRRRAILKLIIGNRSLHDNTTDNGTKVINGDPRNIYQEHNILTPRQGIQMTQEHCWGVVPQLFRAEYPGK